jgi:hypothetical protein
MARSAALILVTCSLLLLAFVTCYFLASGCAMLERIEVSDWMFSMR